MKNGFLWIIVLLLLSGCSRIIDTSDGAYLTTLNNTYKLEDKGMYLVKDYTDPNFDSGKVLNGDVTIHNAIDVDLKVKILYGTALYRFTIFPNSTSQEANMDFLTRIVNSYGSMNTLSIILRDTDDFLLEKIDINLGDAPVGSFDDNNNHLGYSYEGKHDISSEIAQNTAYISFQWMIEEP